MSITVTDMLESFGITGHRIFSPESADSAWLCELPNGDRRIVTQENMDRLVNAFVEKVLLYGEREEE